MSDLKEYRRVIASARRLARVDADPVAAQGAIEAVRQRLVAGSSRGARRRTWMFLSGGIAAAAAIVIAIIALTVTSPARVSAAEALDQTAQATRDYKGWVHITPVNLKGPKSATQPVLKALHINTASGANAIAFEIMGK